MRRRSSAVDLGAYVRALGLLVRNPVIALAPLAAAMANAALSGLAPPRSGGLIESLNGGLWSIIFFLIDSFGLGVALIAADSAWRYGKVDFESAFDEGKRKAGDILMAAIGFNFIVFAAGLVGGIVPGLALVIVPLAAYFFIYALPAAAIGGIPGGASLQVSIERVKANYAAAAVVFVVCVVLYFGIMFYGLPRALYDSALFATLPGVAAKIITALVEALVWSYIALVLSKSYSDVAFGRRF